MVKGVILVVLVAQMVKGVRLVVLVAQMVKGVRLVIIGLRVSELRAPVWSLA